MYVNDIIPSANYLKQHGTLINRLRPMWKPSSNRPIQNGLACDQYSPLFSRYYIEKGASPDIYYPGPDTHNPPRRFGRNSWEIWAADQENGPQGPCQYPQLFYCDVNDPARELATGGEDTNTPRTPSSPTWFSATRKGEVEVQWDMPNPQGAFCDPANDLYGYRLFVSTTSRGWNYDDGLDCLPSALKALKSSKVRWTPEMYEPRFRPPPGDVLDVSVTADLSGWELNCQPKTRSNSLGRPFSLEIKAERDPYNKGLLRTVNSCKFLTLPDGKLYITLMALGRRGMAVGRELFPMSEEIAV